MSIHSERLKKKIDELQAILKKFPEGSLICARNGNHYKWYQTDGINRKYIPKAQRNIAEKLAAKKYYALMLQDLLTEYDAVQSYLKEHKEGECEKLFEHDEYQKLLKPIIEQISKNAQNYPTNANTCSNVMPFRIDRYKFVSCSSRIFC